MLYLYIEGYISGWNLNGQRTGNVKGTLISLLLKDGHWDVTFIVPLRMGTQKCSTFAVQFIFYCFSREQGLEM
jgi:hypothetical protein